MIEFTWRSPKEPPELWDEPIIIWTGNDRIQIASNTKGRISGPVVNNKKTYTYYSRWPFFKNAYNAKGWAYQKDLIKT